MIVNLIIGLVQAIFGAIGFLLSNAWAFGVLFLVIGICTIREYKGSGIFCILLAVMVLGSALSHWL